MKREIRVIGIDDAPYNFEEKECLLIGVVCRGKEYVDGVLSSKITVDGKDATEKIGEMVKYCKFYDQLKCVFLDGITYAGFNIVDLERLNEIVNIPIIAIIKQKPNVEKFFKAMKRLEDWNNLEKIAKKAGKIYEVETKGKIYFQFKGCLLEEAKELIKKSVSRSSIPECLRIAHLIGKGIVYGESGRGR